MSDLPYTWRVQKPRMSLGRWICEVVTAGTWFWISVPGMDAADAEKRARVIAKALNEHENDQEQRSAAGP